ncbi:MAG TPA: hypothetical protein VJ875_12020 [Pyrinomonadaceae bacterium]|nr:hypothetical protein [Pyrinomonadaceae bacterium]
MSSQSTDWSKLLDQDVSVSGTAENAKAGPLLMTSPGDPILIRGLDQWPPEIVGKKVKVKAIVRRVPGFPKAQSRGKQTMQGTAGGRDMWVLELKRYEVID